MKYIRWTAWTLILMMIMTPAMAEDAIDEGERSFIGIYEETPEQIIVSAMEIYSWFTICPLDVDPELAGNGGTVFRVADEVLCDYDIMMRLLDFSFSPELVEEMFAHETYTVIDGLLYGRGGGRAIDPLISEVSYEETERSKERIVYTVTVCYLGDEDMEPEVLEFVREPVKGQWVFTQFPFFW